MTAKPKTKTDTKAKKAETPAPKSETPATEAPASAAAPESGGGSKKAAAPSRPISYFSSVSTDEYRSGWEIAFGGGAHKGKRKPAKRNGKLPVTIALNDADLDPATREQLEALFRKQVKKKRLNYDKLSANGQVSWEISCRISGT